MILKDYFDYVFYDLSDPRTYDWPMMQDPILIMSLLAFYFYFVLNLGPKLMQNREPFEFSNIIKCYNVLQIILNLYLLYEGFAAAWSKYSWTCEPVDRSNAPEALRVARFVYLFFLVKLADLVDTVFFVLRKKFNQISFLHVYHHGGMAIAVWIAVKYFPGGHLTFTGVINSVVHAIMYFYYLMSTMGPQYQKYLWWKKYLTTLQMVQFVIVFLHTSQLLFYDCGVPRWIVIAFLPQVVLIMYLFGEFFRRNYTTSKDNFAANMSDKGECKKTS